MGFLSDILTSLHGRRLGITANGELVSETHMGTGLVYGGLVSVLSAATAAYTASSTETLMCSFTVPANKLRVGTVIKFSFQGIRTAVNSTDTLQTKVYFGGAGIGGTAVLTMAATNGAANDIIAGEGEIVIRTVGSSGTFVAKTQAPSIEAASGAALLQKYIASTAIDTTGSNVIGVALKCSTTNAGNSARIDMFNVWIA